MNIYKILKMFIMNIYTLNRKAKGNKMKLPELKDYVFLSSPESTNTYIVNRSGKVRLYNESETMGLIPAQRRKLDLPYLFDLNDHLSGVQTWHWKNGYLPILDIRDYSGRQVKMMAQDKELWVVFDKEFFFYPGKVPLSKDRFLKAEECIEKYWSNWFADGKVLPAIHPLIDNGWKSSIVQAKSAFWGLHPKYGVEKYAEMRADAFPPAVLSMCGMLNQFEHFREAQDTMSYYLDRFIREDGTIDYYGPALSEYGALLVSASEIAAAPGGTDWLNDSIHPLKKMIYLLIRKMNPWMSPVDKSYQLIIDSPEADTCNDKGAFLHNNMMVCRGLIEISEALKDTSFRNLAVETAYAADVLKNRIDKAVSALRQKYEFIPHRLELEKPMLSFTETLDSAYANYRYLLEMLESGMLSREDSMNIINARENRGGELYGMTILGWPEYEHGFDNWPISSYAKSLLELEDRKRFMKVLAGHILHHQTRDTFTAYEHVSAKGDPRVAFGDWCVPSQLTMPRMLAWSFSYRRYDRTIMEWGGPSQTEVAAFLESDL